MDQDVSVRIWILMPFNGSLHININTCFSFIFSSSDRVGTDSEKKISRQHLSIESIFPESKLKNDII